ncbi:MAG: DUF501 domain-containing protein [Actinomycetota bacterium]|nr:DUF501 domain-containing protein [Actinomycetota bacterium]
MSAQLGRPARGDIAVVHRCVYGLPTVVRVAPRLEDGTPFPTVFWLVCPLARRLVGRMESEGAMAAVNDRLASDATLAAEYKAVAERYVVFRDRLGQPLPGSPAAGGMPTYVKCLHVQLAHFLATGDNPVGAWTHGELAPMSCPGPCVEEDVLGAVYASLPPPGAVAGAWEAAAPVEERPRPTQRRTGTSRGGN